MSIKELTREQVLTLTLEQKDRWWLENVYRGDMPQLNLRSALTGMILGGVLSLTNLYVGIKTGWTLGVGLSAVILSFAMFKLFSRLGIGSEMSILENNAMQSVATSAGYMTMPLVSSLPAFMIVTGQVIPMSHTLIWIMLTPILGVLFAFPLKKRFINDEQLPFPDGYAAGVVLSSLHEDRDGKEGVFKAKVLGLGAALSGFFELIRNSSVMSSLKIGFLAIPEYFDEFLYKFCTPAILGTPLKDMTVRFETSLVMIGAGGIMGIKTGASLVLGACINYLILAPWLIKVGIIEHATFKSITMWALWFGAAMMTTASLYSFFSKPSTIIEPFKKMLNKGAAKKDPLEAIELPLWISLAGVPVVGALIVVLGHAWFGFGYFEGIVAIPLIFVFTLIAVTSTGLTSITPGGALGKLTQLTYSIISPGNISTNLMAAGINADVSLSASNLLMDIKPGYMLGGKPRQQAVGHILGVFAGAMVAVPVYYMIFDNNISLFTSDKLPMPSVTVWKAVAEVLTKGLDALHPTAKIAALVGAILGVALEWLNTRSKGRFPISAMGLGLAFVLRFTDSIAIGTGAFLVWLFEKKLKPGTGKHRVLVENSENLCAGIIAGGSLMGIILIILENVVFAK
ncbi:MAG: OPT family oligopeptide transporter [Proteobacteria bacterium]|nr:OPT family oligopeptide transporter [Pseudomonadota bacterium]